jgi:hypothetical protein
VNNPVYSIGSKQAKPSEMHPKDPTCALRVLGFGIVVRTSPFRVSLFQIFLRIDVMYATDTNTILLNLGIKYNTETNY